MKNLTSFTLATFLLLSIFSFSQGNGNQLWKINGNTADENHYIGTKNEFPLKFRTNDIERFRITPSGFLGIGTSSPEAKLDVNGDVILREHVTLKNLGQSNGLDNKELVLIDGNGNLTRGSASNLAEIVYQKECADGSSESPVWNHGFNKIFVKCQGIHVGIGTGAPRVSLDVIGRLYSRNISLGQADPVSFNGLFQAKYGQNSSMQANLFLLENLERKLFQINNNGFVGIGNEEPRGSLDVRGDTYTEKLAIGNIPSRC